MVPAPARTILWLLQSFDCVPFADQEMMAGGTTLEETALGWNDIAGLLDDERAGNR